MLFVLDKIIIFVATRASQVYLVTLSLLVFLLVVTVTG